MSIGTSITPRGYNVDVTGRDYTLDPSPLFGVADRAFASQRENMRMVGEIGRQGVALGEYIGARQQLGRVKAALADLDINDPDFAKKYSAVVADNPLAFTNERVSPATKAAIAPLLSAASQAMQDRAALQRAKVMAGYQRSLADYRAGLQQDYYDHQVENPRPGTPRQPGLGERLLMGDLTGSPQAPTDPAASASAPTSAFTFAPSETPGGAYDPQYPTDPGTSSAADDLLTPFGPDDGLFPTGAGNTTTPDAAPDASAATEGEGDGSTRIPPNIVNTRLGPMRVTSVGEGANLEPVVEAVPIREVPEGYVDVPDQIIPETGTAASRKLVAKPERSAAEIKADEDALNTYISTRPEVIKMTDAATSAKALVESQRARVAAMQDGPEKERVANQLAEDIILAGKADAAAALATNTARLQFAAKENPNVRDALLADYEESLLINSMPIYGPAVGSGGPAPAPAPSPPAPSVAEQLKANDMEVRAENKRWTRAKNFAVVEALKLDSALGLSPGTVLRSVAQGDEQGMTQVLKAVKKHNIKSPLLRPYTSQESGRNGVRWGESKLLGRSFRDVLRAAAQDRGMNVPGSGAARSGNTFRIGNPFTKE